MNYLFCCRSGRRVAVDVSPGTDEVGTFLPSPISSYFPVVSLSCLLSYLLVELAAPVSQGPVQLLCGCRINSKIAFKCFQVLFFFFFSSHQPCCRAVVNKPHCRTCWKWSCTENSSKEARGNGFPWICLLPQIGITAWSDFDTSGGGHLFLGTAGSSLQ